MKSVIPIRNNTMNSANPTLRSGEFSVDDTDAASTPDDAFDEPESSAPEELEEETGIDLTDASDLDADNVPADEEQSRVVQAPD